jgi:hypothetical protein
MESLEARDATIGGSGQGDRTLRVWAYGLCTAFLVWPTLYNKFPLIYSDTGTYIGAAIDGFVPSDRPIYYSIFISIVGLLQSIYAVPVVQAALIVGVLSVVLSAALGPLSIPWLVLALGLLGVLTPLPWLTSWLMPDVFAGLLILAFIALIVYWKRLTMAERLGLGTILIFSTLVATGNFLLLFLMTVAFLIGEWVSVRRLDKIRGLALLGMLLCSYCLSAFPNYLYHGRFSINPDSSAFLAARLFQGGLMARYLQGRCPSWPEIPLCPFLDEVKTTTGNEFLWKGDSLASRTNARKENRALYSSFVREAIIYNLPQFIMNGLSESGHLLAATSLGEDMRDDNLRPFGPEEHPLFWIKQIYPNYFDRALHARQQRGNLGASKFNSFYRIVTYASYAGLVICVWWWRREGRRDLACASGMVLLALLLNAVVFGFLVGSYDRYQARLAWISTFFVVVAFLSVAMDPAVRRRFAIWANDLGSALLAAGRRR